MMNQYLVSYTLFSQQKSLAGKDTNPTNSLDAALDIFNILEAGDDLRVTLLPAGNSLLIQAEKDGMYLELDYAAGGYMGKTMSKRDAKEVLENHQKYFDSPEVHGFELTEFS